METINRNNYEEYFLLYVDGELDAANRFAVENFVRQNADLAVEFDMLMNTKFPPEVIEYTDKENLLRTEGNNINETNYEEYFLLYIDNELSAAKREEVEMFVLKHPKLQDEFITLKQAVLAPEIISYGDKSDLYRTAKRRAIYLKPWQIAAAAIFIGVCTVGVLLMQQATDITVQVAVNRPVKDQPQSHDATVKPADTAQQQIQQPQQIIAEQPLPKKENKNAIAVVKKNGQNVIKKPLQRDAGSKPQQVAIERPVIAHDNNNIVNPQKEPPVELHGIASIPEQNSEKQNDVAALQAQQTEPDKTTSDYTVYPVAYKEINTSDDDRSLHVGMFDLNKTKVKTLFKKAGRMLGGKSNDFANEDGKLQVANFEIETKKQ
ncbi:MAG TPA: hypothetical protein VFW07_17040 [Parafilimonas sp.]|nr:hypothetical protein [Parafilimonas sp.]